MKRLILPLCGVLIMGLLPVTTLAQVQPASGPAVAANAAEPAAAMPANPRVEIFPFVSVSPGQGDWIGRGIQESLQSDVSRTGATLLIPVHAPLPGDDPVTLARQNKADLAVIGTYQIVGDDVRVNGHLIDTATNTTIGGFAATGPQKNLFALEDALGEQLRRSLPASPSAQQLARAFDQAATQQPPPPPAPSIVYQEAPQVYTPPPTVNNYYDTVPSSGYYYPETYYGYVDPFPFGFYGGIGLYSGGYYHHDHDHDRSYYGRGDGYSGRFGTASNGRSSSRGGVSTFGGAGRTSGGVGHSFGGGQSVGGGHSFGGGHGSGGSGRR